MEIQISSENGIVPSRDQDCAARLQKLLKAGTMDTIFVLSPGEYFLASAIKLEGLQNVKIIGYGARFISRYDPCDPYSFRGAFDFTGCKNCTISGLTLTTDRDPNCAGHVKAVNVDECTVDIALDEGFHLSGKESIRCVDSCDERLIPNRHIYFADDHGYRYSLIRENVIRLYAGQSNQGQLRRLLAGEPVCMKHSLYPRCPLLFTECSGMELNDITVESSPGVTCGIYPRSENFTFRRFQIRLPYGSKRIYASNADGIHVTGLAGKLVIEDCLFEHLGDDAINIHNEGATVYKLEGNVVTCYARRFYSEPDEKRSRLSDKWARPGDIVLVYDRETMLQKGRFRVVSYEVNRLVMEGLVGSINEGDVLANEALATHAEIRRCTVRNSRARAFILQSHHVTVEDCYLYGTAGSAIIIAPDTERWNEMTPGQDIEICNTVFDSCGAYIQERNAAIVIAVQHDSGKNDAAYPAGVHNRIRIRDNLFVNLPGGTVYAAAVKDMKIIGNRIVNCRRNPGFSAEAMHICNCEEMVSFDNLLFSTMALQRV